jgi:spore germination protein KA
MNTSVNDSFSTHLADNARLLAQLLGNSTDLVIKELQPDDFTQINVIYIDGLVHTQVLHQSILYSLQDRFLTERLEGLAAD